MKKFNPVGWFEIYVEDIDRARKFYETVLGITMSDLPNPSDDGSKMVAFTETDAGENPGATGALVQMEGVSSGGNSVLVYFMSADCSVEEARVDDAGGEVVKPKMPIGPHGFISLCNDTEGNMFGLHSMQ